MKAYGEELQFFKDGVCTLCPRNCRLQESKPGFCGIRTLREGRAVLDVYGKSTSLQIDPVEKKPLHHFYPGSPILSVGTVGCNMGCDFCQNSSISKSREVTLLRDSSPELLIENCLAQGIDLIALTYNDPIVFFEYALDTAALAKEAGIRTAAVSAGYINPEPRRIFFESMDAANIDLKGFTDSFYRKHCKAEMQYVLDTLHFIKHHTQCWLEVTTLLIPGENDSEEELDRMTDWYAEHLGSDTPWHFSAFHPAYKLQSLPRTPAETLIRAYELARSKGIQFVYLGNLPLPDYQNTSCPKCSALLIDRSGYWVHLEPDFSNGSCQSCGYHIPGCWGA